MTDEQPRHLPQSMTEFLTENERKRAEFEARITQLSKEQMTGPADAAGWTVKDHIAHLSAWERSIIFVLEGKPRHEGLGVPEEVYLIPGNYDEINEIIFENNKTRSLDDVLGEFHTVHADMLTLLNAMTWDDLNRTYAYYLPDEPGERSEAPVWPLVYGNTGGHYEEHLPWINAILDQSE